MAFEVQHTKGVDDNNKAFVLTEAISLDTVKRKYHCLLLNDDRVMSHREYNERPTMADPTDYGHAVFHALGDTGSFETLPYRPMPYPINDIDGFETYSFDDGTEKKLWAICDAGNNRAHVVYRNNQTLQRLVYQQVDLAAQSLQDRITAKAIKGYGRKSTSSKYLADLQTLDTLAF